MTCPSDYVPHMAQAIKDSFTLTVAQLNPIAGDIEGNVKKAREARARAARQGADLIAFTELYLTGYPIEDLVLKPALQKAASEACEALARDTGDGACGSPTATRRRGRTERQGESRVTGSASTW